MTHMEQAVNRLVQLIEERDGLVANGVFTSVAKKYGVSVKELKKRVRERKTA